MREFTSYNRNVFRRSLNLSLHNFITPFCYITFSPAFSLFSVLIMFSINSCSPKIQLKRFRIRAMHYATPFNLFWIVFNHKISRWRISTTFFAILSAVLSIALRWEMVDWKTIGTLSLHDKRPNLQKDTDSVSIQNELLSTILFSNELRAWHWKLPFLHAVDSFSLTGNLVLYWCILNVEIVGYVLWVCVRACIAMRLNCVQWNAAKTKPSWKSV